MPALLVEGIKMNYEAQSVLKEELLPCGTADGQTVPSSTVLGPFCGTLDIPVLYLDQERWFCQAAEFLGVL